MILVTGASGFVGHKIMECCRNTIACPSLRDKTEDEIRRIVEESVNHSSVDTIIHTAAISDIGVCQSNPEASYIANVLIPVYLAKAVRAVGKVRTGGSLETVETVEPGKMARTVKGNDIKLICFSSDQVYTGLADDGPYTEEMTNGSTPANLYAEHKLEMEQRVLDIVPEAVMLRAEWMYDYYLKKPNYFMNMINATGVVSFSSRQYRGITYVKEVAENMENVRELPGGVYNFGSETTKSMYEISRDFLALIRTAGKDSVTVEDCEPRHNVWLNCGKAQEPDEVFRNVEDGLKACAEDYDMLQKIME